jgi:hypothetical protein
MVSCVPNRFAKIVLHIPVGVGESVLDTDGVIESDADIDCDGVSEGVCVVEGVEETCEGVTELVCVVEEVGLAETVTDADSEGEIDAGRVLEGVVDTDGDGVIDSDCVFEIVFDTEDDGVNVFVAEGVLLDDGEGLGNANARVMR